MGAFVLVHSPVTGPSTWRWVADELKARGHRVTVPAVPPAATQLGWAAFVGAVGALSARIDSPVLVGHSGAGPLLPRIGTRMRARALVFVDADIPPEAGETTLVPGEFLEFLRGLANGGVLPPWSEWYGPDSMRELIPDDRARGIVSAELPAVPLSYFESRVPVPATAGRARRAATSCSARRGTRSRRRRRRPAAGRSPGCRARTWTSSTGRTQSSTRSLSVAGESGAGEPGAGTSGAGASRVSGNIGRWGAGRGNVRRWEADGAGTSQGALIAARASGVGNVGPNAGGWSVAGEALVAGRHASLEPAAVSCRVRSSAASTTAAALSLRPGA